MWFSVEKLAAVVHKVAIHKVAIHKVAVHKVTVHKITAHKVIVNNAIVHRQFNNRTSGKTENVKNQEQYPCLSYSQSKTLPILVC